MELKELEIPCGYCETRGCAECGGTGYLVASPEAERLLAFVLHQIGPMLAGREGAGGAPSGSVFTPHPAPPPSRCA